MPVHGPTICTSACIRICAFDVAVVYRADKHDSGSLAHLRARYRVEDGFRESISIEGGAGRDPLRCAPPRGAMGISDSPFFTNNTAPTKSSDYCGPTVAPAA